MEKLINVYKASAGSGKTYTLTHEYINLILKDEDAYKHLLAVTFTNKATDEMKQRILEELYKMSCDPACAEREMARNVLIRILHDYPAFSVSTIDKFFQNVMRAFARELGRMVTYGIELDSDLVRGTAVDNLFADLDKDENAELLKWLIDYSLERIDNGESWRIYNDISNLSKSLFSENFKIKNNGVELTLQEQMAQISRLKGRIGEIISSFEKECEAIGKEAMAIMEHYGLECSDFKGGVKSPFNILKYISEGNRLGEPLKPTFENCHNNLESWYAKTKKSEAGKFEGAYNGGLNDSIGKLIEWHNLHMKEYQTALCVKSNLNSLGILGYVYSYITDYCREKNVMLLSETTHLLGQIIDGSDTPFIYEKTGIWINNFMLDEFQDTSLMQWQNFVPLLFNSIASGNRNLIVGDVKQSIYRFRNSDWNILKSGIDSRFGEGVEHRSLDVNWRSAKNIVDFNNNFFEAASQEAAAIYEPERSDAEKESVKFSKEIVDVYSNFRQSVPENGVTGGYVDVTFINKEDVESADLLYDDVMTACLLENVERLLSNGYRQRDIGVLVRWNNEGAIVAQSLVNAGYRVISADSLAVSSSASVKRVVNILKCMDDPENLSISIYSVLADAEGESAAISAEECERLKKMPPYQMCEEIIRTHLTEEQKKDIAFLQAFLDIVMEYSVNHGSNLSAFLKWWDESGVKKSISSPEEQDAIQVMTVHKAKGLAFEAVIVPYFSCMLDHSPRKAPILWSNAAGELLGYDGPLPVKYLQSLKDTLFCSDYYKEKLEVYVDNLNVAYVAFTRPKRELIILAQAPVPSKSGVMPMQSVSHILHSYFERNDECCRECKVLDFEGIELEVQKFSIGEPLPLDVKDTGDYGWFELKQRFDSPLDAGRIRTAMQSGSINDDLTLRDDGIMMHEIFEGIATLDDVEKIPDSSLRMQVRTMISSVEERGWFSDEWKVYRECSILRPDGQLLRPDRVIVKGNQAIVIDYKFGEFTRDNEKYHKQVRGYMQLLMDMGFTTVSGYLWYVRESEVEQVR
ncbi:MAG: UvrD-helicase domain-containing protein [Bacteroidales bacterium]|nr:UvrD-helicase domain-containing protein [Bacteroidales bacterium]